MNRPITGHRQRRAAIGLAVVALLVGACGDSVDQPGDERNDDAPAVEPAPPQEPGEENDDADLPPEVGAAVEDLAEHLGIDAADITVVTFADVTWPDGSIGCPEPGQAYTQALVAGSRLVLEAEDSEYFYHAGRQPALVRCDRAPQNPVDEATS